MAKQLDKANSNHGTAREPQSPQQWEEFLDQQMQAAMQMYPTQLRPSLETQASYAVEWYKIAQEVGAHRFADALGQAIRESDFFPVISKIRACAGLGSKQQTASGASAAWLYVQEYIREWGCEGRSIVYGGVTHDPPRLTDRIAHAVRQVGGLMAIDRVERDALPFMRKDFATAWEGYEQSFAALNSLLLGSPLVGLKQLVAGADTRSLPGIAERGESTLSQFAAAKSMSDPKPPARVWAGPLSEAELEQKKAQAAEVARKYER